MHSKQPKHTASSRAGVLAPGVALVRQSGLALRRAPCWLAILLLAGGCVAGVPAVYAYSNTQGPQVAPPADVSRSTLLWGAAVILAATLAAQLVVYNLNWRFKHQAAEPEEPVNSPENLLLNQQSIQALFEELRAGPTAHPPHAAQHYGAGKAAPKPGGGHPPAAAHALTSFLAWAPTEAAKLQSLFVQASRANDAASRQEALGALSERLRSLCYGCRVPELRPIWQLAFVLEGLCTQLADEPFEVTASALQTVAGGLDLLQTLSAEGLAPELTVQAPARFLAVDDDAVSRFAVAASLKRAFDPPDLAPDAQTGLAMAARQTYDAIFLDVEMPGMDGFELCKRIRETALNPTTPVVFVTRHSDFDSRAQAALSGGQYLLGKPFLALEITVKALTLVLRSRQQRPGPNVKSGK